MKTRRTTGQLPRMASTVTRRLGRCHGRWDQLDRRRLHLAGPPRYTTAWTPTSCAGASPWSPAAVAVSAPRSPHASRRSGRGWWCAAGPAADLDALAASIDGVAITCDLADRADTDRMLAEVAALGRVDVLVNNAGIAESAPLAGTDDAMWDRLHRAERHRAVPRDPQPGAGDGGGRVGAGGDHRVQRRAHRLRLHRGVLRGQARGGRHDPRAGGRPGPHRRDRSTRCVPGGSRPRWPTRPSRASPTRPGAAPTAATRRR
jgi:hypothetical protein